MTSGFSVGDAVQTTLGKGVVREIRRHGRLLVELKGRALELDQRSVSALATGRTSHRTSSVVPRGSAPNPPHAGETGATADVDLHGLTVAEAIVRADQAVNDALLADVVELRLIHGRSGGRIRAALHRRLRDVSAVAAFRLDPRNAGVTIVRF